MWKVVFVRYDGSMFTDEQDEPEEATRDWVRLVDLPNLKVDEWQGPHPSYDYHWSIWYR